MTDALGVQAGIVYLVGAGPGDPGLLTVRARELLESCQCIIYDALVSPEIMALANPAAEQIFVGKRGAQHTLEQDEINALLAQKAQAGSSILRFKGGDPYLFGRGAEEALYLVERGVRVEVVPGITAGIAAPAYAGIPVTHREHASAVAFVTGHEDPTKPESALDWAALAKVGTLCFYMGVKNIGRISGELSKHRSPQTPVAVIQWGSTPRQRTVTGTLASIEKVVRETGLTAPALTIVGDVVSCRAQLNFFERRALFGKRVVVTRARAQVSDLGSGLRDLGAWVHEFPLIKIAPTAGGELQQAVSGLSTAQFDWVLFTSVNGVDAFFAELERNGLDARAFRAKVAAIGSASARRLKEKGILADLVPTQYVAESIIEALRSGAAIQGMRFLLARADIARSELPQMLTKLGGKVVDLVAYRTVLEADADDEGLKALLAGQIDAVTFTSGSTARSFVQVLGPERLAKVLASARLRCFSIGPQTSKSMREAGLPIHGEAKVHDIPGLLSMLQEFSW